MSRVVHFYSGLYSMTTGNYLIADGPPPGKKLCRVDYILLGLCSTLGPFSMGSMFCIISAATSFAQLQDVMAKVSYLDK